MGNFLLSLFSPESLSWAGFIGLMVALIGEAAVYVVSKGWKTFHREAAFAFAVLAAGAYAVERVGDDAVFDGLRTRVTAAESKTAARKLTTAQQADVSQKVSAFKSQQFFGQVGTPIPDARILWASIVKALQDGGWQLIPAEGETGNPPAVDVLGPPEAVAVFVPKDDVATVPAANALILALRDAGLKANGGYSDKPDMRPNKIKIAIGARPAE